jgi:hypothetical protein
LYTVFFHESILSFELIQPPAIINGPTQALS